MALLRRKKDNRKVTAERFGKMIRAFGKAMGEVLDDPELQKKAKEFAQSAVDAAAKVADSKIKDSEIRARFRTVGKAAETLGKSLEKHFQDEESPAKKS